MGIDRSLVKEHPQLDELICGICLDVLDLDTKSGECEHYYCRTCINGWLEKNKRCPTCNKEFKSKETHRFLKVTLEQLLVQCKFCNIKIKYEDLKSHEQTCNKWQCTIPNGCQMKMAIHHDSIEGCILNLKAALEHTDELENCYGFICQRKCIFQKKEKKKVGDK